jgi:hypothetical protein
MGGSYSRYNLLTRLLIGAMKNLIARFRRKIVLLFTTTIEVLLV